MEDAAARLGALGGPTKSALKLNLPVTSETSEKEAAIRAAADRLTGMTTTSGLEGGRIWQGGVTEIRRLDYQMGGSAVGAAPASVTTITKRVQQSHRSSLRFSPRVDVLEAREGPPDGVSAGPSGGFVDEARLTLSRCDGCRPYEDERRLARFLEKVEATCFRPPRLPGGEDGDGDASPPAVPTAIVECAERLATHAAERGDGEACEAWRRRAGQQRGAKSSTFKAPYLEAQFPTQFQSSLFGPR